MLYTTKHDIKTRAQNKYNSDYYRQSYYYRLLLVVVAVLDVVIMIIDYPQCFMLHLHSSL